MLLHFPHLHPECVPGGAVPGALFLDPGLSAEPVSHDHFRPDSLPLDAAAAHSLLEDCIRFGEQFTKPGDMAAYGLQPSPRDRGESVSVLEQELQRRLAGEKGGEEKAHPALARAQFLLLLAWVLEERALELRGLTQGMEQAWSRFGATLGVDEDDALDKAELQLDNVISHMHAPETENPNLPWPLLLEAVCAFLPEDGVLVVRDRDIVEVFLENGVESAPLPDGMNLPESSRFVWSAAWKLAGLRSAPAKRPLLTREVRVAVVPVQV
jgi:hypothetical protein